MASTRTHDIVATVGEYTDRQTGEKKKRYVTCGSAFTDDQGRMSIKLDTIPVSPEWTGWLSLYEPKPKGERQATSRSPRQPATEQRAEITEGAMEDDDIPF